MAKGKSHIRAGVFVECLPKDGIKEAEWVHANSNDLPVKAIVARADLRSTNIEETLAGLSALRNGAPVRGIRQILNFEPTWPFVGAKDICATPDFQKG